MAEPQPPSVHEGADADDEAPGVPASAEDRKAAAALSSVAARDDDGSQPAREVDQEALGKAIQNLDISGKDGAGKPEPVEKKKVVKVDPADVGLVVGGAGTASEAMADTAADGRTGPHQAQGYGTAQGARGGCRQGAGGVRDGIGMTDGAGAGMEFQKMSKRFLYIKSTRFQDRETLTALPRALSCQKCDCGL